jgi:hypothetical protein
MKLNSIQKSAILKCIEEMSELSLELIHALNKPKKNNRRKIILEVKDVEVCLEKIKQVFDNSEKIN